jgi:uncharacterized membrane protein
MSSETARVEAFSDRVFAIAITLLILNLKVPSGPAGHLGAALARQWPTYAAFLLSFFFIGIMWVNHHRLFNHIRRSDNGLLFLNLLLLLGITVVPFPTALLAAHYGTADRTVAAAVFNGTYVVLAVFFNVLGTMRFGPGRWTRRLTNPPTLFPGSMLSDRSLIWSVWGLPGLVFRPVSF